MGLTRTQLRRSMAVEGLMLSPVATLLGAALGLAFAWVGVRVMVSGVVEEVGLTVPVWQVGGIALVSALAGLGACVLPARKAAGSPRRRAGAGLRAHRSPQTGGPGPAV